MKKLNDDDVLKVAKLAMINLTPTEIEKYKKQFNSILEFIDKLEEINTDEVDFESHVALKNIFHDDEVLPSLPADKLVEQTKNKNGYVVISSVLKDLK